MKKIYALASLGVFHIALVLLFWWEGSGRYFSAHTPGGVYIALGRLFGLVGELALLMQLVLIGRIRVIEQMFGFDRLNKVHRVLGRATIAILLAHPIFLAAGYSQRSGTSLTAQLISFLSNWEGILAATVALVLFVVLGGISAAIVRKRLRYETWYFVHLLAYVGIGLAFNHQIESGDMSRGGALTYWVTTNFLVFGIVLAYRFVRPLYFYAKHQFRVQKIVQENDLVTSIYIDGNAMESFAFKAGQYANLTFLQEGMWYTHPFSFSSEPNGEYLRFTAKAAGDFTRTLGQLKEGTRVIIDGPLGVFTERSDKEKYLLIAGGIGITPILALAQSLSKKGKDVVVLYSIKKESDGVFMEELRRLPIRLVSIYSDDPQASGEHGLMDAQCITRLAPDAQEREVYLCGPQPMMEFVVEQLESLKVSKKTVHFEKFAY